MHQNKSNENSLYVNLRLKSYRNYLMLTQEEFAKELNIKKNTYRDYENGNRSVPASLLKKITDYTPSSQKLSKVNSNWLLLGKGNITREKEERNIAFSKAYRISYVIRLQGIDLQEVAYYLHLSDKFLAHLLDNYKASLPDFNGNRLLFWSDEYLRIALISFFELNPDWFDMGTGEIFKYGS